ncbi:MAG: putative type II secretion system protein HxcR [candidate division WS2 bacterium]|nr:putative type II secretion system protein HxcR [Candidatus Lithacetigena glycinireducens]
MLKKPLGQLLLETGYITDNDLRRALSEQKNTGAPLGQILVEMGILSPQVLGQILADQEGLTYRKVLGIPLSLEVIQLLPEETIKDKKIFPLKITDGILEVAVLPPINPLVLDNVKEITGYKIRTFLVTDIEFQQLLNQYFNIKTSSDKTLKGVDIYVEEEVTPVSVDTPVVKFTDSLITDAISNNASDIHFDPTPEGIRIRYRVDGMLSDVMNITSGIEEAVISRFKVLGGMDIAEKRRSQDGRFSYEVNGKTYDFRIASTDSKHGEKISIRILRKAQIMIELSRLGMPENTLREYEKLIIRPYGVILAVGPTGSGKTTTLYSTLNKISNPTKSFFTIEDPVEYELPGIIQTQVNLKAGLTFASGVRSVLRLDPDIIMVGEVRDADTAKAVVEGALTGHLVFSTLHANDAPSTIIRLLEIGVEPFLVASSVIGVVAQRLIRTICLFCKEEYPASPEEVALLYKTVPLDSVMLWRGTGCSACNFTGYRGRTGVFEILTINKSLRDAIIRKDSASVLRQIALDSGMTSMLENGFGKVKSGQTTIEEILRVVPLEE